MKNVIIFQEFVKNKGKYKKEELFNFLRAQVDNSLRFGWKPNDIFICTNLDFRYENVNVVEMERICTYNRFFNRMYGLYELLDKKIITENFWHHDFDDWQINKFDFPKFDGDLAMTKFCDFQQWCVSEIFVKPSSLDIWNLFYDFTEVNREHLEKNETLGDDAILNLIYKNYPEIQSRFHQLNSRYCVGCTQFEDRYNASQLPIYIIAMKPNKDDITQFKNKNLIDKNLISILENNKLLIKQ